MRSLGKGERMWIRTHGMKRVDTVRQLENLKMKLRGVSKFEMNKQEESVALRKTSFDRRGKGYDG